MPRKSKHSRLSELKETQYNPRTISDSALAGLKLSLKEFGDLSGIVYNTKLDALVAGHQRVKAIISEFGDLDIYRRNGDDSETKIITPKGDAFTVRFVKWDKVKHDLALIAANAQSIQGEYTDQLGYVIEGVRYEAPDMYEGLMLSGLGNAVIDYEPEGTTDENSEGENLNRKHGEGVIFELLMMDKDKKFVVELIRKVMETDGIKSMDKALVKICKLAEKEYE